MRPIRTIILFSVSILMGNTLVWATLVTSGSPFLWKHAAIPTVAGILVAMAISYVLNKHDKDLKDLAELRGKLDADSSLRVTLAVSAAESERSVHRLEHQLIQTQKLEQIGRLTASVVHDFNNILTGIIGGVSYLNEIVDSDDERETVEFVMEACDRAQHLNRRLLSFSRRREDQIECVDVNETVKQLVPTLEWFKVPMNTVEMQLSSAKLPVWFGEGALEHVLLNLILNAAQAMKGTKGTIRIETDRVDERVRISVIDSGPGMDAETRARAFESFFTTKKTGTGLGLAIVKAAADLYGAEVQLESEPGKGTRFDIYLEPALMSDLEPNMSWELKVPKGIGEHVLIVESDPTISAVSERALTNHGFLVSTCETANCATKKIATTGDPYDVIVASFTLSDGDGSDLVRELKSADVDTSYILTGGLREMESVATELGALFLMRPFSAAEFRQAVNTVIEAKIAANRGKKKKRGKKGPRSRLATPLLDSVRPNDY